MRSGTRVRGLIRSAVGSGSALTSGRRGADRGLGLADQVGAHGLGPLVVDGARRPGEGRLLLRRQGGDLDAAGAQFPDGGVVPAIEAEAPARQRDLVAAGFLGAFALRAMALPGLFARKMSGWTLMFYAEAISVIGSILAMNVLGGLVWGLISFYILFQIRGLYKN